MKAHLNYLRIAPRKVRLVADLIRNKKTKDALRILSFVEKRAAEPVLKTLQSAIAGAMHDFQVDENNLFVAQVFVNEGPKLKRIRPRAKGSAYQIQKKTSHLTIILGELEKGKKGKQEMKKSLRSETLGHSDSASHQTQMGSRPKASKEKVVAEKVKAKKPFVDTSKKQQEKATSVVSGARTRFQRKSI